MKRHAALLALLVVAMAASVGAGCAPVPLPEPIEREQNVEPVRPDSGPSRDEVVRQAR